MDVQHERQMSETKRNTKATTIRGVLREKDFRVQAATLVVQRVMSQVERVNHRGWVLRQRRRHLLWEIPGDETLKRKFNLLSENSIPGLKD